IERQVKSAAECLQIEPALRHSEERVAGGVYTPQDESGDAHRFTQELARSCAERGVAFRYGTVVEAIEPEADAIRLQGGERLLADAYVVALGSYSPLLLRGLGLKIPVYPLKGYSITLPLDAAEPKTAPEVSLTDEAHKIVISRLGNRLRAAGTAELTGYDASVNPVRCNAIVRRIRQLFPGLGGITVVERWAGLRPATPNNVPIIGRTRLMIGTLFGVAGRRPAHLSTTVIPPRPGNSCRIRRTIALQRTGLTEASYPVSSAVPAARRRLPRREITI